MGDSSNIALAILVWIGGLAILAIMLYVVAEECFNDYGQSNAKMRIAKFIRLAIKLCVCGSGLLIAGSILSVLFIVTMKAFGISL